MPPQPLCMNVPMSDMTSARRRFRNIGVRSGRHGLGAASPDSEAEPLGEGILQMLPKVD